MFVYVTKDHRICLNKNFNETFYSTSTSNNIFTLWQCWNGLHPFRLQKEYFQDDVFPDTKVTWEPALTGSDWFSGKDGQLKTICLCPEGMKHCEYFIGQYLTLKWNQMRGIRGIVFNSHIFPIPCVFPYAMGSGRSRCFFLPELTSKKNCRGRGPSHSPPPPTVLPVIQSY